MTTVRLSLLRAPMYPDPGADQGRHRFTVSLRPGGIPDAIADGYAQHLPLREHRGNPVRPLITVDSTAVIVESVKLAEDHSGDLVVRLYEAHGNRARAKLCTVFGWTQVQTTDLLERPIDAQGVIATEEPGQSVLLTLRPFQLATLRFASPTAPE